MSHPGLRSILEWWEVSYKSSSNWTLAASTRQKSCSSRAGANGSREGTLGSEMSPSVLTIKMMSPTSKSKEKLCTCQSWGRRMRSMDGQGSYRKLQIWPRQNEGMGGLKQERSPVRFRFILLKGLWLWYDTAVERTKGGWKTSKEPVPW